MKITAHVRGRGIEVFVDENGTFTAEYNGQKVKGSTLVAVKEALERIVAADRIEPIHFLEYEGGVLRRGKCTGLHYGNGNMIVVYEGQMGYQQPYSLDGVIHPEYEAAYRKLCDACIAADKARKQFEEDFGFDVKDAVKLALAAKAKARQ